MSNNSNFFVPTLKKTEENLNFKYRNVIKLFEKVRPVLLNIHEHELSLLKCPWKVSFWLTDWNSPHTGVFVTMKSHKQRQKIRSLGAKQALELTVAACTAPACLSLPSLRFFEGETLRWVWGGVISQEIRFSATSTQTGLAGNFDQMD